MFGWNNFSFDRKKKTVVEITVNHEKYVTPFLIKFKSDDTHFEYLAIGLDKEEMESLQFQINAAVNEYDLGEEEVDVEVSPV
jgi:hypothetical protein